MVLKEENRPVEERKEYRLEETLIYRIYSRTLTPLLESVARRWIFLGIVSASRQYSIFDYLSMVTSLIGVSMPVFWLGLMLMLVFALNLGWFPVSGRISVGTELEVITNFYVLDAILTRNWNAL